MKAKSVTRNPSKTRTVEQAATAQGRAVRFAENVLEDDDLAEELEGLTVEEYAERKGLRLISNPRKEATPMAKTLRQLQQENKQLKEENEALNQRLDVILDLASADDEEDEDDDSDDDAAEDADEDEDEDVDSESEDDEDE